MLEQRVQKNTFIENPTLSPSPDNSDLDIFYRYLSFVRSFPVLNSNQEDFLFRSMGKGKGLTHAKVGLDELRANGEDFTEAFANSRHIRDLIINCNLRMVIPVARKYSGLTLMDRIQEGNVGLIKAVDAFNPDADSRFYNFAINHVRGTILAARHGDNLVYFPERVSEAVGIAWNIFDNFYQKEQKAPTMEEWAELLSSKSELSKKQASDALGSMLLGRSRPISVSSQSNTTDNPGDLKIEDIIADPKASFADRVDARLDAASALPQIFSLLTPQEQEIINLRFGFGDVAENLTEEFVAQRLNRTRRRILQIQKQAFDKVRADKKLQKFA